MKGGESPPRDPLSRKGRCLFMELYFGNIYQRYEYHVNCRGTESGKSRELLDLRIKDGGERWKLNLITHEKNLLEIKTAICF
jgi:hypothetical protein